MPINKKDGDRPTCSEPRVHALYSAWSDFLGTHVDESVPPARVWDTKPIYFPWLTWQGRHDTSAVARVLAESLPSEEADAETEVKAVFPDSGLPQPLPANARLLDP